MLCSAVNETGEGQGLDRSLIEALHAAAGKVVVSATGGGSTAISSLLAIPGASRTVIEATVPYDPAALSHYLGGAPDQPCSGTTARAMAMVAFQRALRYEPDSRQPLFGIGCSAALTTDRQRKGQDRCFVALQSIDETREYSLTLSREHRDRADQEAICAELIILTLAHGCGIAEPELALYDDERFSVRVQVAEAAWRELFAGHLTYTNHPIDDPHLIFPGAFNPLHDGHREMMRIAEEETGERALLEISAFNVDKPPLDYIEMHARQEGLKAFPLTYTNAPTFVEKASIFPDSTFIVGSDTIERIGHIRYYNDSVEQRDLAIDNIAAADVRFLVFGRTTDDTFIGLDDIDIPDKLRAISTGVPESRFRVDASSSAIRKT